MLIHIIMNGLRHHILSLRLHLALLLTVILFGTGTAAFVANQRTAHKEYMEYRAKTIETERERAESNLSRYATERQTYLLPPRADAFMDDSRERFLPNSFRFNAYNVFGFELNPVSANPFLKPARELSWMYIVAIVIGFVVFLFTFDAVSGEKEARTLALALSNPVSRVMFLFGKYLSAVCTALLVLIPGICISLIIVFITGTVHLTPLVLGETAGFLLAVAVFVVCIAAFGMLSSVLSRSSNVSLLVAVSFWLLFVTIVPNTALFWGQSLFPIEPAHSVAERIQKEREDINNNAPRGSWAASFDNPFLPQHELRAAIQTKHMLSEKRIRDAWYRDMIRQVDRTRMVTCVSPMSLFQYTSEAVVGGGYVRFLKNWDDLHAFQGRFLSFFKEKDSADPASPHWYNPAEDFSTTRKGVSFAEVPQYREKTIPFAKRISYAGAFCLVMLLYAAGVFFLTAVLFGKYDVR